MEPEEGVDADADAHQAEALADAVIILRLQVDVGEAPVQLACGLMLDAAAADGS